MSTDAGSAPVSISSQSGTQLAALDTVTSASSAPAQTGSPTHARPSSSSASLNAAAAASSSSPALSAASSAAALSSNEPAEKGNSAASTAAAAAASSTSSFWKQDVSQGVIRLGVCAMDRKARSKPMRNILSRLLATGKFDIAVFGDKVILDEEIDNWPVCDVLISFFSSGFPLDKAIDYVRLRNPVCVNDLPLQKVFWDRRLVLAVLDKIGVPTSKRLECNRDGGPKLDRSISEVVEQNLGIKIDRPREMSTLEMRGDDTIVVDGKSLDKPFVEKPVSGEDHNVNIYFSTRKGGGARRLFRKVGNQSSAWEPEMTVPRLDGSFVYEQFIDVENSEDIKVYTLGPSFVHAESRKSPVVDGVVKRNTEGKEVRYICQLTDAEKKMARDISLAFQQNICGFDLLRANGKSYVIDVNGWSFVKGNDFYYDKCAEILARFCDKMLPSIPRAPKDKVADSPREKSWQLKSMIAVFRHADRTPKCKIKFTFKSKDACSKPFIDLLQGRKSEIILRDSDQLQFVADAADEALRYPDVDHDRMLQLKKIIQKKVAYSGTKTQLKPTFDSDGHCEKVQVVVKWGGEFTHAARYQSREAADNFRKDVAIMNRDLFNHTHVFSSSERRVIATAEIFTSAFLGPRAPTDNNGLQTLVVRKDLLDDSNAAKDEMDKVKRKLKSLCRPGEHARPEFNWPNVNEDPFEVVTETIELMKYHREVMGKNWAALDVENVQARWCCGEYPYLFRERWEGLFGDWCDVEPEKFDPSRVSELYDSLKYDSLHNRNFLIAIFDPTKSSAAQAIPPPRVVLKSRHSSARNSSSTTAEAMSGGAEGSGGRTHSGSSASSSHSGGGGSAAAAPGRGSGSGARSSSRSSSVDSRSASGSGSSAGAGAGPGAPPSAAELSADTVPKNLRELYKRAKWLFDLIAPQEYGIERPEKLDIGLLTSLPLLEQIVQDLEGSAKQDHGFANFYFTKESHIHTLTNLILLSDLPIVMPQIPELDYLSYTSLEVYERFKGERKEYSVRVTLSEGAHSAVLDASLDAKHALQVQPRRALTGYIALDEVVSILRRHSALAAERLFRKSTTPLEGFLPLEGDEVYKGANRTFEEIRRFKRDLGTNRPGSLYSGASEKGD